MLVGLFVFVGGSVTTITRKCIDPHQTGSVGKGNDHLQLVKILAVPRPREGVCGGAKNFGSALLQPARSVCVSLGVFFIVPLIFFLRLFLYCVS